MSPLALRVVPILFAVLWSTGYIGAKLGAAHAEPFTLLALRFGLVLVVLAPVLLAWRVPWPKGRDALQALLVGVLVHGVYLGGIFWAIGNGMPAGIAALVVSLQPLSTGLLAWPLLGERLTWLQAAGLVLGLGGTWLVLSPRLASTAALADGGLPWSTLVVAVASLLSITLGTILQKRLPARVDARTGFALQFVGALATVGAASLTLESGRVDWTPEFMAVLAWLSLVLSLGAFWLLMLMLRHNAVSRVAALFYLIPVITALMAWAWFDEQLSLVQAVGMALVCVAVVLASRSPQPAPPATPAPNSRP